MWVGVRVVCAVALMTKSILLASAGSEGEGGAGEDLEIPGRLTIYEDSRTKCVPI